jgi:hypothetical protein
MRPTFRQKFDFILKRHFLVPGPRIKGYKYLEDLGLSKPEQREMLNYVEDTFKVRFSEQDERQIRTVHDTLSILDKYLNGHNSTLKAS